MSSLTDLIVLLPFIVTAATPVAVMLIIAFFRRQGLTVSLTLLGLLIALLMSGLLLRLLNEPRQLTPLLLIDRYALFYISLVLAATASIAALAHGYFGRMQVIRDEFYVLLLIASLGGMVLAASSHFASFFLGLELLTVSLYGMTGYLRTRDRSIEAAVKYLILAAVSSAFALFGMALLYAASGSLEFRGLATTTGSSPLIAAGLGSFLVGIGFKLAIVPFQLWTPDVYEGAPLPATAFVATVSKGAVFAAALRFAEAADLRSRPGLLIALSGIAVLSMFVGNLLALLQQNVKRILAYSSIAHMGYLLVAFLAAGSLAMTASAVYLAAYVITTLGAFGVMTVLSGPDRDADDLEDYRGLAWRSPLLAAVLTAMLLSLAGMPLTAGFIGKFLVAAAAVQGALWLPVIAFVLSSVIGLFFYLRIVLMLFQQPGRSIPAPQQVPLLGGTVLAMLLAALLWTGVMPSRLLTIIERAMQFP